LQPIENGRGHIQQSLKAVTDRNDPEIEPYKPDNLGIITEYLRQPRAKDRQNDEKSKPDIKRSLAAENYGLVNAACSFAPKFCAIKGVNAALTAKTPIKANASIRLATPKAATASNPKPAIR
jgi:hypothetical protein